MLLVVLCLAAAIRLWRLDGIPPGLTHDEAGHGHDATAILQGARPIYETVGYGREPFYDYVLAGAMELIGRSTLTLRLVSVLAGLGTLMVTFAWACVAFDPTTALLATAFQAASFWSLATSRQVLRSSLLPLLLTGAIYCYWRYVGSRQGDRWRAGIGWVIPFGLLVGATLYTYIPARAIWVVFPLFLAYLLCCHRATLARVWWPTLVGVLVGLLIAAPLFVYLRAHPEAEQRLAMLAAPLWALREGDLSVVKARAWSAIAGLVIPGQGDSFLAYNIPGRPLMDPLTGLLFLIGVMISVARWRQKASAFLLLWFTIGFSPSLVTGSTASFTRSIAALPALFVFPAVAGVAASRWMALRWGRAFRWIAGIGIVTLIAGTGWLNARDYFVVWGDSPHVRAAYKRTLVEAAVYLDSAPERSVAAISSPNPQAPHDPYVFEMNLRREGLPTRWFDGRRALLIPEESAARMVVSLGAPLEPYFSDLPGLALRQQFDLRPDDLDPFFSVYDWTPVDTLVALQSRVQGRPLTGTLPIDFGGILQFLGYDLRTPEVAPGGIIELITLWRVGGPDTAKLPDPAWVEQELVLFTHLLDGTGTIIAQEDRLDAPSWDWQPGDVVAQIHRVAVPHDTAPVGAVLQVGVFRRADGARLPVEVGGTVVDDRLVLQRVEVTSR